MGAARARGYEGPMEFDAPNFRILMPGSEGGAVNLHNCYHDYCEASRAERRAVVDKYSNLFVQADIPDTFEAARRNLLPVLRTGAFLQAAQLGPLAGDAKPSTGFAAADFSDDTVMLLAWDTEHLTRILDTSQLEKWGVSQEAASTIALDNLRDLAPEQFVQLGANLFASDWNDAYDSSRILLPDLVHRVAGQHPVVMIPTRGRMLLSASHSREDLLTLVSYAQSAIETEGRRVSTLMYEYVDGKAVPYVPLDEEVARKLADLRRMALQEDYAEQKQLLDQGFEQQGTDIFVATYMLVKGDDERIFSVSTWTAGVDALLPETDRIVLGYLDEPGREGRRWNVAWADLVAAAGHLMVRQEGYQLPRWRVRAFPDEAALNALAAE
nr:DUF1444 family protein [Massilia brevitalea]